MESLIDPQVKQLLDCLPGFWYGKDLQSVYHYANPRDAELLGLRSPEDIVGLTDLDLPCEAAQSAHLFQAQDREVIRSGRTLRILEFQRYADQQWRALLISKMPLRDDEHNIVGILGHAEEHNPRDLLELGEQLGKVVANAKGVAEQFSGSISFTIGSPSRGPTLSPLQEEVLFLQLHGRSPHQIGRALGIACRRVEAQQRTLRDKFLATNDGELIDEATKLGYLHHLPQSLGKRSLWPILGED